MAVYSPVITCYEEFGTYKEGASRTGSPTGAVDLRVPWANRHALMTDLLANSRPWPHGAYTKPPLANSCAIKPFLTTSATDGQTITYDDAIVSVVYNHEARDLVSETLEPTSDFITLDHRFFRWSAANGEPLKQNEAPGKLRRGLNLSRTLYNVASPLSTQLLTSVGGVNNAEYVSSLLGLTFPIGTLLFTPPNLKITVDTTGTDGFTVAMKFMYRPEGWNKYWRAKSQVYDTIFIVGGSAYKSYPEVSMSDLLS